MLTVDLAQTFPDESKKQYLYWKDFFISKWKEVPEEEHIAEELKKKFEEGEFSDAATGLTLKMLSHWVIAGLKCAKMI